MNSIDDLIRRYLSDTITEEERAHLMSLIRSGAIEQPLKRRIENTFKDEFKKDDVPGIEAKKRAEEIFSLIVRDERKKGEEKIIKRRFRERSIVLLRYAAILVAGMVGMWLYVRQTKDTPKEAVKSETAPQFITVINSESFTKQITLHDGSTIALEPGSEIRYPEMFGQEREVYLSGDAFFEVKRDPSHPFLVYANEVTTRVLGTSFRVKANQGEKEIVVAVKTGKVSVFAKSGDKKFSNQNIEEVTLTPNQQAIYKRVEHIVLKQIVEEPQLIVGQAAIKSNYVNEPVVLILNALSESYGVDIHYDAETLSGCTLTSDIIEGEGLYEQLEIVCGALGGHFKMESDASIVIEAGGCHNK
ncbi:MAG TPA: FecR domain-containing protein [Cyclobacteriaceae bacterium]|nr:FecR domain-containing protein [Cyclobacteriaceae bacterium]